MPARVWEFCQWLRRYYAKHVRGHPTLNHWLDVSREAARRGITIHEDGEIEFRRH